MKAWERGPTGPRNHSRTHFVPMPVRSFPTGARGRGPSPCRGVRRQHPYAPAAAAPSPYRVPSDEAHQPLSRWDNPWSKPDRGKATIGQNESWNRSTGRPRTAGGTRRAVRAPVRSPPPGRRRRGGGRTGTGRSSPLRRSADRHGSVSPGCRGKEFRQRAASRVSPGRNFCCSLPARGKRGSVLCSTVRGRAGCR